MPSWIEQFDAKVALSPECLVSVPKCKHSFCRWLVVDSVAFAGRTVDAPVRQLRGRRVPELHVEGDGAGTEDSEEDAAVDIF